MAFPEPPPTEERTTCFFHTDRETGRRCTRCGRPACWECLHDAPVGAHCWECLKAAQPPRSEQARRAVLSTARDPLLVTKTLIGLNVIVWIIDLTQGGAFGDIGFGFGSSAVSTSSFEARWGYFNPALAAGQWERVVTSGFIHFGFFHIVGNMFLLFIVGRMLEPGIGRFRFALIYFASLVAGSLGVAVIGDRNLNGGASGAVLGIAAAALVALLLRGVSFYNSGLGPVIGITIVITFIAPGISIGAHVGGVIAGALLGFVMLHPRYAARNRVIGVVLSLAIMVGGSIGAVALARNKYPECTSGGSLPVSATQQVSVHDVCTLKFQR